MNRTDQDETPILDLSSIKTQLSSLVVFRRVLDDPVIEALYKLAGLKSAFSDEIIFAYARYAHLLLEEGGDLGRHIERLLLADENAYLRLKVKGAKIDDALERLVGQELHVLENIAAIDMKAISGALGCKNLFPFPESEMLPLARRYQTRINEISLRGYGMYAEHTMFTFDERGLQPVKTPDPVGLSQLYGYESQRSEVRKNVLALLDGRPAANMLLYGDSGTGKSSTAKAFANEYACRGLRLVEVKRSALKSIDILVGLLSENPLKFILFIDDLSLDGTGTELGPLKAALEGSACVRAENIIVCATSNRRRLVRQTFSEREGDDVNRSETIEEKTSLSERFGLAIGFFKPSRSEYIDIVRSIANSKNIPFTPELQLFAEQHAQRHGGRSGRVARQFIDSIN